MAFSNDAKKLYRLVKNLKDSINIMEANCGFIYGLQYANKGSRDNYMYQREVHPHIFYRYPVSKLKNTLYLPILHLFAYSGTAISNCH